MTIVYICRKCGHEYNQNTARERYEDGCVGCGQVPCYHCTSVIYCCPKCGSNNHTEIEKSDFDYEEEDEENEE